MSTSACFTPIGDICKYSTLLPCEFVRLCICSKQELQTIYSHKSVGKFGNVSLCKAVCGTDCYLEVGSGSVR